MPGQRNKNGAGGINGMAKLLALHERESAPLINLSIVKKSSLKGILMILHSSLPANLP